MVKKASVIRDTLGMTSDKGGLYAIYPFDNINSNGFGLFKIGMAKESLHNRLDHYFTYFPDKFIIVALLEFVDYPKEVYSRAGEKYKGVVKIRKSKKNPDGGEKTVYHKYVFEQEKKCHEFLLSKKGTTQLYSNGRVRNPQMVLGDNDEMVRVSDKGATEWFYTKEEWIKEWFEKAHKKFSPPRLQKRNRKNQIIFATTGR